MGDIKKCMDCFNLKTVLATHENLPRLTYGDRTRVKSALKWRGEAWIYFCKKGKLTQTVYSEQTSRPRDERLRVIQNFKACKSFEGFD